MKHFFLKPFEIIPLKPETGLESYLLSAPFLKALYLGVAVKGGVLNEKWPKEKGLTHFLEHLVLRGTKKFPTAKLLNSYLEEKGGYKEAITTLEYTLFKGAIPLKDKERLFKVLSEVIFSPLLSLKKIKSEIEIIKKEYLKRQNEISLLAYQKLKELIFKDYPLAREIIQDISFLKKLKRREIINYWQKYYQLSNLVVVIIGDINKIEAIELVKKYFGSKGKETEIESKKFIFAKESFDFKKGFLEIKSKIILPSQAYVTLGAPVLIRNPHDYFVLRVFNAMISKGVSSPLFEKIREKEGLVYQINTEIIEQSIPLFKISFYCDKKDTSRIIKKIFKIINENKDFPKLLNLAKKKLEGQWLIALDNPNYLLLNLVNDIIFRGKPYSYNDILKEIEKVSLREIKSLVSTFLRPQNFSIVKVVAGK